MGKRRLIDFLIFLTIMVMAKVLFAQNIELSPQLGHSNSINCLVFSPDSQYIASAADDGLIKIWESKSGMLFKTIVGDSRPISSLAYHPDGKLLYSGDKSGLLCVWDITAPGKKLINTFQGPIEGISSLACSPDGAMLCSGSGYGKVQLWNLNDTSQKGELQSVVRLASSVAFSPDGKNIAFTFGQSNLKIWDIARMADISTFTGHSAAITELVYSRSGKYIATGGKDGRLILWDLTTGVAKQTWNVSVAVNAVQFTENDKAIVIGASNKGIQVFEIGKTACFKTIPVSGRDIKALAVRKNWIYSGYADGEIKVYKIKDKIEEVIFGTYLKSSSWISGLSQSKTLCLNQGRLIAFYDRKSGKLSQTLQANAELLISVILNNNEKYLSYCDLLSRVYVHDLKNDKGWQLALRDLKPNCIAFHPLSSLLAIGGKDGVIIILDVVTNTILSEFKSHQSSVNNLVFDSSGEFLVSTDCNKKIRVSNIHNPADNREFINENSNFTSVCFVNQDQSLVAGTEEGRLIEFDFATLQAKFRDLPHQRKIDILTSFNNWLVAGSTDQTLTVWDWNQRIIVKRISCNMPTINYADILDTNILCTASDDGLIRFYNLKTGLLTATLSIIEKDAFIAWSSDNHFTANPAGLKYLLVNANGKLVPAMSFTQTLMVETLDELLK